MNLEEGVCEGVDWIHLAQARVQWGAENTVMNLRVSIKEGNFLTS
jgi:hypothetical protein